MDGLVDKKNFQIHSKLGNDLFTNSNKKRKIQDVLYQNQIGPGTFNNKFASNVFTEPLESIPRSRDDSLAKDFKEESSRKVITAKRTNRISVSDLDSETSSTIRKRPARSIKWIDRIIISLSPDDTTEKSLELSPNRSDYRDVSIENCHSISPDAIVCYGSRGKTTVLDRNSTAAHLFNAVDGWLILAQATPGIYRELVKFAIYQIFLRCDGCKDRSNRRSWSSPILPANHPACVPDWRMSVEHWDQLSSTLK
jgi:hypothetical protein